MPSLRFFLSAGSFFIVASITSLRCGGTEGVGFDGGGPGDATGSEGGSCTPGQTACSEGALSTCSANGTWGAPVACATGTCTGGTCTFVVGDASNDGAQSTAWTEYWLLGQLPSQTTVYLYARNGAKVTFGGTISKPTTITVAPDTFQALNAGTLGYQASGTAWYFLEANGDNEFMMSADRVVTIPNWATFHGDMLHDKPGHDLSKTYYFAWAQSGPNDDEVVLYAPQTTSVTARVFSNKGTVVTKTVSVQGLFVSGYLTTWLSPLDVGYGLEITADHPIAAADFDEVNDPTHPTSGYYFGWLGQTQLYDEYMHIHYSSNNTYAYHSFYDPGKSTDTYYAMGGAQVTTRADASETSAILYHQTLGYNIATVPYLVHYIATSGVADSFVTPTATDVRPAAAYMGWNASLAQLEIYADSAASVKVYDGRSHTLRGTFNVSAGTITTKVLDTIGFTAGQPFVVAVEANVPVYQEVRMSDGATYNSPDFLRQYPSELGPPVN